MCGFLNGENRAFGLRAVRRNLERSVICRHFNRQSAVDRDFTKGNPVTVLRRREGRFQLRTVQRA